MIHEVFPYLIVTDAAAALAFYERVFGAKEEMRLLDGSGRVSHAQVRLGPATVMLADEHPELGLLGPRTLGGTAVTLHLHVDDVDALAAAACAAGATLVRPPTDHPHGERQCRVRDPFGHEWLLGQEIGAVDPAEMQRRLHEETR